MVDRLEIIAKNGDTRAEDRKNRLNSRGFAVDSISLVDVYTLDGHLEQEQLKTVASMLTNPVVQTSSINEPLVPNLFDWAIEIGYLPGVTDNVATTATQGIADALQTTLADTQGVYTSQTTFLSGNLTKEDVQHIAETMANPLIQRIHIKSYDEFQQANGMDTVVPKVNLNTQPKVDIVDIRNATDAELAVIGKQGIANADGSRRGPLALDITYMKAIQSYFAKLQRNPTDVELESIAQTWSEHCKHTIFADPLDEIIDGLYKTFIIGATNKIREEKGNKDFCVSVFTDNSGAIIFDENYLITDKAETHNSPSALDPFGGSITGIVGVNRDTIGFGMGAKPVINRYGFCFADPNDDAPLYKGPGFTQKMLSPRMIMDGVIDGVNVGGNCSGIPTPQGFVTFDKRYKGKPLVFVGTVGLIPNKVNGKPSHEKQAQPGDYIVMIGGRVGKDGIHGATFSSEAMDAGSPATAVQIGDPITQKKESDAVVKEARDLGLYNSITDNGAGGLSCSTAEMAKECGGCYVKLDNVPLKYPGLEPWEIWISESQERMTLSVSKDKWVPFFDLMRRRGVEASIIGEFNNSGKCVVAYEGKTVMDIDMDFLHDGLPARPMQTAYTKIEHEEPIMQKADDATQSLLDMLGRLNIASKEFISQQYDHEVQGGSVIKPLQGRGRVNGDATVTRPLLESKKGVATSQGINPYYSDIDTYHMAANAIDTAIRNNIAVGGNLEHLALMDNFCWCSSDNPERLGQLKAAVQACHDYAIAYGTPFISGKDSMFNNFKGFDEKGEPTKISVPPTLLVSSISVMPDSTTAISLDAKIAGDLVYVIGSTYKEMGGSEYFEMLGEKERGERYVGNGVPEVNAQVNKEIYAALSKAIREGVVASAQSVHRGGLAVALAKTAMGGKLGMDVNLDVAPGHLMDDQAFLYSESSGRLVVTIAPQYQEKFEKIMSSVQIGKIGTITLDDTFRVTSGNNELVKTTVDKLEKSYKATFEGY